MTVQRFSKRYGYLDTEPCRQVEMDVLGTQVGSNGYTTVAQADLLADVLDLGPGKLLLDIGAGIGWPGLYLAAGSGCSVVLTDVPANSMTTAAGRAKEQGMGDRCDCVLASGSMLPFRPGSFDAVVHIDTL